MTQRLAALLSFALLCTLPANPAWADTPNYNSVYQDASERSYSDENKPLAQAIVGQLMRGKARNAVELAESFLEKPGLNPYEISNTNYFLASAHEIMARGNRRDRDAADRHRLAALRAYRDGIEARGFLDSEMNLQRRVDINDLLQALGEEDYYGWFDYHHQALVHPAPVLPSGVEPSNPPARCKMIFDLSDSGEPGRIKGFCPSPELLAAASRTLKNWRFVPSADDTTGLRRKSLKRHLYFEAPAGTTQP